MSPSAVQWASGNNGLKPGTVMFNAKMSNSGMPYQISASGSNMEMMKTFGFTTYSKARGCTFAAGTKLAEAADRRLRAVSN